MIYKPPCVQLINNLFFAIHQIFALLREGSNCKCMNSPSQFWLPSNKPWFLCATRVQLLNLEKASPPGLLVFNRYTSPLPNISTSSSPQSVIWGPPKPSPGNCQKTPGNSGFPFGENRRAKTKAVPAKNPEKFILGIPNGHFGMIFLAG